MFSGLRKCLRRAFRRRPPPPEEPHREAIQLTTFRRRIDGNALWQKTPNAVIRRICSYLSPLDRMCFILTSSDIRAAIYNKNPKLPERDHRRMLFRLERDGAFADDILCCLCWKFHPPRRSLGWGMDIAGRACISYGHKRITMLMTSKWLPRQVHFDLVAAQTRKYRHQAGQHGLLSATNSESLFMCCTYLDALGRDRTWVYITCKVSHGYLIMKTETVLLADERPEGVMQGIPLLLNQLYQRPHVGFCCEHVHWGTYQDYIFHPPGTRDPDDRGRDLRYLQECLWTHNKCPGYMYAGGQVVKCGEVIWKDLGEVKGCSHCATDMTFSVKRTLDGVNMLVFTSWKNLGDGVDITDPHWISHLEAQPRITRGRPAGCVYGDIYRMFELHGSKYHPNQEVWRRCMLRTFQAKERALREQSYPMSKVPSRMSDGSLSTSSRRQAIAQAASASSFYGDIDQISSLPSLPSPTAVDVSNVSFGDGSFLVHKGQWSPKD